MTVAERYENLKSKVENRRDDFLNFMEFVEKKTSYLTAPASTKFHLCKDGGLLEHSVNVTENLLKIKNSLAPEISDESCVIVGLLHDLGKVGMPNKPRYIKNEPTPKQKQWGYPANPPYNSAMLDYHNVNKNEKFKEMPKTFIIFITEHDVLEDGEQIYHIERMILETKKFFPDLEHIIYVNGSYKDESGSALGDLIHDFFCENPADMRHRQLAKRVEFLKDNKRGVRKMCKIIEDLQNESKKEILLDSIRNLMETLNLTVQQAMVALKIPVDKQNEYRPLI